MPGALLDIDLAASAYYVVEGESETVLDAETSAKMCNDMGIEPKYDQDGNILPMILSNDELVAYLPQNELSIAFQSAGSNDRLNRLSFSLSIEGSFPNDVLKLHQISIVLSLKGMEWGRDCLRIKEKVLKQL